MSVSPTGRWAAVLAVIDGRVSTAILGFGKEKFRWVRGGYWATRWSRDGRNLYIAARGASLSNPAGALDIALDASVPPDVPAPAAAAGARILPHDVGGFAPGPDPGTYAFTRTEWLRNIYRIPLRP